MQGGQACWEKGNRVKSQSTAIKGSGFERHHFMLESSFLSCDVCMNVRMFPLFVVTYCYCRNGYFDVFDIVRCFFWLCAHSRCLSLNFMLLLPVMMTIMILVDGV